MEEGFRLTGFKTKKELVNHALSELVRKSLHNMTRLLNSGLLGSGIGADILLVSLVVLPALFLRRNDGLVQGLSWGLSVGLCRGL